MSRPGAAVRRAVAAYAARAGLDLDPAAFAPSRPDRRAAWAAFTRPRPGPALRPGEGEWLALRLGVKPVLRELLDPAAWEARRAEVAAAGLHAEVVALEVGRAAAGGFVATGAMRAGARAAGDAFDAPTAARVRHAAGAQVVVHVGRDPDRVREAAALDRELLEGRPAPARAWDLVRRHGALLGYPACCVDAYAEALPVHDNRAVLARAAARSARFDPRLDAASPGAFRFLGWLPCRFDCEASLALVRPVEAALRRASPVAFGLVRRLLGMPRLVLDDRAQLRLDGYPDPARPGRLRYRDVFTPLALDGDRAALAEEWVIFAHLGAPLLLGDAVDVAADALRVARAGEPVATVARPPDLLVLPFAWEDGGP